MTKITDIPAIRFKGFSDTWEQRKFSELVQIERGGSPRPIDDFITDAPNGLNWVKIGDAPTQGNYITKTAEKIRPEGLPKTREVHPGDLILSNSMSFGKPYIMGIDGCIHDGWLLIRNTYGVFDLTFLCHLLGTPQMLSQYRSLAAGSTVNNLNKELVGNIYVTIPSITEQRVLGAYLEQLDNLITLHQRKYDKLTNVKKSMLEKMFPQNGSNVPEIRFKGFTEAWEQRKVSELFKVTRGYVLAATLTEPAKTDEMPYPVYSSQTKDNGLMGYYKDYLYEDAITWTTDGANAGTVNYRAGKFYCTNVCGVLLSNEVTANQMIAEALNNVAKGYVSYVGNPKLMNNVMADIEIMIPTHAEEREKLSVFFRNLDNLITLHQRKCDDTKELKKYMLQKMFPKNGEKFPEIRFKGFTEAWEQRKLGEVAKYRNGKAHENSISEDGEYIVVNSKFVSTDGKVRKFSDEQIEPLYKGEIAFVLSDVPNGRAIARTFLIDKNEKYTLNQRIAGITPKETTDSYFLHILMNRNKYFLKFDDGNKQTNLSINDVMQFNEMYPSYNEQSKIGAFFSNLDHLITLHQRKCDTLKELKKYMLQNMFPKKG